MHNEINIKFDRFFSGEMNPAERSAFESEILNNPVHAESVRLHQNVRSLLADRNTMDFLDTIAQLNKEFNLEEEELPEAKILPLDNSKPVRSLWPKMLAAASVAALLIGFFFFLNQSTKSAASLYADYNSPPQFYENVMGTDEVSIKGASLFKAEKYKLAIPLLETQLTENPDNINLKFMLAYANSNVGNDKVAEKLFDDLLKYKDTVLLDDIKWHKALHLLKLERFKECLGIMNKISPEFLDMKNRRELVEHVAKHIR